MNENTKKSLKIAAITAIILLAVSTFAFAYAGTFNGSKAADDEKQTAIQGIPPMMRGYFMSNSTNGWLERMAETRCGSLPWVRYFLQNATLSSVQGTVVTQFKGMLILNTGSGQVTVLLPKDWSLGNEVIGRANLFNSTFASTGDNVTLKVLENDVFSNASFGLNIMIGYEAVDATGTHAYAVLPFNIQPTT